MSHSHEVRFTKNMLTGPFEGRLMPAVLKMPSATRAAEVALHLNAAGVLQDLRTAGAYTCLDTRLEVIEVELEDERGWDEYDQADRDYDLGVEASL